MSGATCGTGLDTFDGSWINVDGVGVGGTGPPAGCANSISQSGYGSNCYDFGGYPSNPLASFWLVLGGAIDPCALAKCSMFCAQTKPTSVPSCTAQLTIADVSLAPGLWSSTFIPRHSSLGTGPVVGIYIYTHGVGIGQSAFRPTSPSASCASTVSPDRGRPYWREHRPESATWARWTCRPAA